MKKTISLILVLSTAIAFADKQADDLTAKRLAYAKAYLEKQGFSYEGVKIVPEQEMTTFAERKEELMRAREEKKRLGYVKTNHPSTNQLLTLSITSKRDLIAHKNDTDPRNTHLKSSVFDLKMAYLPTAVPSSVADTYIGAAPYLTFLKDKGWVGVAQFFNNKAVGNCSFSENNIKLSHAAAVLAKENVRDDVNGKITMVEVAGTLTAGFTYTVEWFDDSFFRSVECANKQYSPDLTNAVIKIAQLIDNQ